MIAGYLEEEFKGNSYTVWSCLRTKSAAVTKQLLNLSREEVEQGKGRKIQLSFVVVAKSRRPVSRKAPSLDQRVAASTPQVETSSSKRKRSGTAKPKAIDTPTRFVKQTNPMNDERLHDSESDFVPSDEDSEVEWMHTMGQVSAGVPLSQKRRRLPHQSFDVDNDDVIILSD